MLEFTFHVDQAHVLRDAACMSIDETHIFIFADIFSHLGSELKIKSKIDLFRLREFIFVRLR